MKLIVKRQQEQTLLFGIRFVVSFRPDLSKGENELVKRYGQPTRTLGAITNVWNGLSVSTFQSGAEYKSNNVGDILAVEAQIKKDCASLKAYLEAADSYGGTEELAF
jgi:hypothetical protein